MAEKDMKDFIAAIDAQQAAPTRPTEVFYPTPAAAGLQIKSDQRVKAHGEVFTPEAVVQRMLDQPEVKDKTWQLTTTFFEPAAGEGAFLVVLLRRKLHTAREQSATADALAVASLQAVASLYGVELLEDNYRQLTATLRALFAREYAAGCRALGVTPDEAVSKSAAAIIAHNMIWGNTLTNEVQTHAAGATKAPITLIDWQPVGTTKVRLQRVPLAVLAPSLPARDDAGNLSVGGQLSLFDQPAVPEAPVVKWTKIYQALD